MVRHVVMWKFKEGTEKEAERFLTGLAALDGVIGEIRFSQVGRNENPENDYDAVLIADFDDFDALERYQKDPRHQAVAAICKSIRLSRTAVDFVL
ncbi:MAG: Dabb family protein [Clostridiales bacterium]|nr:Dabb family protein [Clostridiales bacterium]